MIDVIVRPYWVIDINGCPDRPRIRGTQYYVSARPNGVFRDHFGKIFYQDGNSAIATLSRFGEVVYGSLGHGVVVDAADVERIATDIAVAIKRDTGLPALVSGSCRQPLADPDFGTPLHHRVPVLPSMPV
jgi:hypothetical protein